MSVKRCDADAFLIIFLILIWGILNLVFVGVNYVIHVYYLTFFHNISFKEIVQNYHTGVIVIFVNVILKK